jgi:hypothetical protein
MWATADVLAAPVKRRKPIKHQTKDTQTIVPGWYIELFGKSRNEVIKVMTDPEDSYHEWTALFYKDYAEGSSGYADISESLELIFENDKVVMVHDHVYYMNGTHNDTHWLDRGGLAKQKPVIRDHTNEKTVRVIDHGMDPLGYFDDMRARLKKKFHAEKPCDDLQLRFIIDRDGTVRNQSVTVVHSSGDATVDKYALDTLYSTKFGPLKGEKHPYGWDLGLTLCSFLKDDNFVK